MNVKLSVHDLPLVAAAAFVVCLSGAVLPGGAAAAGEAKAGVRVFNPPEPVEGPSRTGFVPPPGDFSHVRAREVRSLQALPERFDWREQGVITEVGDQGNCGCCYAFAAVSDFESKVLIDGGPLYDFSVNNVKECDWWALNTGLASCSGGNASMVASFLSQKGTVLESCDPFVAQNRNCKDTCPYILTLTDWLQISGDEVAPTEAIKQYVHDYGPMFVAMIAANGLGWPSEFSAYDGSYTLYWEDTGSAYLDHAVLIVGWDDTLSYAGGGHGAWIVKNSWGTDWGDNGFFTIAYGSAKIGSYASTITGWKMYDDNGVVLFHDEAGFMGTALGYENETAWGLCKYVPEDPLRIERVEFWTTDAASDVDIYIYDGFNGSTLGGLLASELDVTVPEYGYHSVVLSEPFNVSATNDIYVVVKITNESYSFPIALDSYGPLSPAYCYVSPDGSSWTDVRNVPECTICAQSDLCIRLRGTRLSTSGTLRVPSEYATITAALDDAASGDTILVAPGTYDEGPLLIDQNIVLVSEAGAESTSIIAAPALAAPAAGTALLSLESVNNACQVIGFTLADFESPGTGGGIVVKDAEPRIAECVVARNSVPAGAGIMVENSSPLIVNCTIVDNSGLAGIYFNAASSGLVDKCLVTGTGDGAGIYCNSTGPVIGCSDLYDNFGGMIVGGSDGGGNFSEDPLYCGRALGDYSLQDGSPCLAGYGCGQVGALGEGCGSQIPAMPVYFISNPGDGAVRLFWTLPEEPIEGAYIVYSTTGYPATWQDGDPVPNGNGGFFPGAAAASDSFDHTGLTNGVTYYYAAYSYNLDWKSAGGLWDSATPADLTPPGPPEHFTAQSGDSSMALSWTYPGDEDLAGVLVRYSTAGYPSLPGDGYPVENGAGGAFEGPPGSDTSFVHEGLDNDTTYYYSAFSYDGVPNYSGPVNAAGTPGIDDTPPGEVRSFVAQPSDRTVRLTWLNPAAADFVQTVIRYSTSSYPAGPTDGLPVENGAGGVFPNEPASVDSFIHTGLTNGVAYYYTAFTADTLSNYSSGASVTAVPQDMIPTGPVTSLTAAEGDGELTLRWTNPADPDFAGVRIVYSTTGYPPGPLDGILANPGGTPAPADSFVHSGLDNDTTYYYSVFAEDHVPNYSPAANVEGVPHDLTPPELVISVFRNPYISNYLDIYVVASEQLVLDSLVVTVGGDRIQMETADSDNFVYRGDYDIFCTGPVTIRARARDERLNPGSAERQFYSTLVTAAGGGIGRSADGLLGFLIGPGAASGDAYLLVWEVPPDTEGSLCSYEVNAGALDLADYAMIEMAYDETVSNPEHLVIRRRTRESETDLDSYIDAERRKVVAYTRETGVFSLAVDPASVTPRRGGKGLAILYNSPNPFEDETEIAYQVPVDGRLRIEIVGIDGRVIKEIFRGGVTAGRHSITWDGRDEGDRKVAAGIYFVRIESPSGVAVRKVAVLR
jgi:C1A family cysteine protease